MSNPTKLLVVGEIVVDFTLPTAKSECKLRLGGIAHAARGLWASNLGYSVAAFCPKYLVEQAEQYFKAHGCSEFIWIGEVTGSPNVIAIGDLTEVSDQKYEDLLRDSKKTFFLEDNLKQLRSYLNVLVFPGIYDLKQLRKHFHGEAKFSFDVAYDIDSFSELAPYSNNIHAIIISTSSSLFHQHGSESLDPLLNSIRDLGAEVFLLKENRGGSRVFFLDDNKVEEIYASLDRTINSVGVGDVYSSVFIATFSGNWSEAAWRGARAATHYSQTTFPDDFKRDVQRSLKLPVNTLQSLGGTSLPWHDRKKFPIYIAGPDFSYVHKPELESAVESLTYHNFYLRRPIKEHGEIDIDSDLETLKYIYRKDLNLIRESSVLFAIPLERDPGTLVEIGLAINLNIPVITYDPRRENKNTMVMAGSSTYSENLDVCLNGLFQSISDLRTKNI